MAKGEGRGWKAYIPTIKRLGQVGLSLVAIKVLLDIVRPKIVASYPAAAKVIPTI
jgi:hypothetical protein